MELLAVVTILGILSTLAGLSLFSAVQKSQGRQCGSFLLLLENAKDSYLIDHPGANIPDEDALLPYLKSGAIPHCPSGGLYSNLTNRMSKCTCNLNTTFSDLPADGIHDLGF